MNIIVLVKYSFWYYIDNGFILKKFVEGGQNETLYTGRAR